MRTFNISTQTYVDKNDPWTGILAAAAFLISSTTNGQKGYSLGQLIFFRNRIPLINHKLDWESIRQRKQAQINKYNISENRHRVDHDYKVGENIMITKHTEYKYEPTYTSPFVITQRFINSMVNLQNGAIKIRYNIRRI